MGAISVQIVSDVGTLLIHLFGVLGCVEIPDRAQRELTMYSEWHALLKRTTEMRAAFERQRIR